jgi:hypothetical protein
MIFLAEGWGGPGNQLYSVYRTRYNIHVSYVTLLVVFYTKELKDLFFVKLRKYLNFYNVQGSKYYLPPCETYDRSSLIYTPTSTV